VAVLHGLVAVVAAGALGGLWALGRRPGRSAGARWATWRDLRPLAVRTPRPGRLVLGAARGRLVAAERGHSVLVVGPTQSYKTSGFAVPAILEWTGPVLAASVKTDLLARTMAWRRRQGTVWVYDPGGATGLPAAGWSPLDAATTWGGARRVAHGLTEAARPQAGGLPDAEFWHAAAAKLLAPLLLAAAWSGRTMADVLRWLDEQEQLEVADALFAAGPAGSQALQAARASWSRDERQRSGVYTTAEMALEAFADPPTQVSPGEWIRPNWLLGAPNTLYLCAPAHEQRRLRPLFSALTTEVLHAAVADSARRGAPLDPPLLVVLDEAANVAPVADLDTLASTAAGHGVQLVSVWQDLAQLTARYGARAGTVVNNHRVKVFLSGIADPATLEHASVLVGDTERLHQPRPAFGVGVGVGPVPAPPATVVRRLLPADALRRMAPGTAVALSGHLPPVRLRLRPWWRDRHLRARAVASNA
jgi:type IV secretion system protein VirD4